MPLATPQGTLDFKSVDTITFVGASSNTVIDTTTGSFGVGVDGNGPTSNLHVVGDALITGNVAVTGTGSLTVPSGTTAQRPATSTNGMIRYNSTTYQYEGWMRDDWFGLSVTNAPQLYPFPAGVPFTFTAVGDARTGPTIGQLQAAYSPAWTGNTSNLNVITQGFQLWTVPKTGTYTIKALGARGGQSGGSGAGQGAYSQGNFYFTEGTKLNIVVGRQGEDGQGATSGGMGAYPNYAGGGGGGASWVLSENKTTLYAVGGGGGGSNGRSSNAANYGTFAGQSQAASTARVGTYYNRYSPGGGASWDTNGNGTSVSQGKSIANGAMGGESGHGQGSRNGGFGGGGGNGATQGGGGAGYGGGNCSDYNVSPGAFGGTTRNNGSSTSFGTHTGNDGSVVVTLN